MLNFLKVGKSYSELRKEREEFRRKLVQLILCEDGPSAETQTGTESSQTSLDLPSREERVVLRYYYYIRQGVDTVHVTPIDCNTLKRISHLIPTKLKKWKDLIQTLTQEVKASHIDCSNVIVKYCWNSLGNRWLYSSG